MSENHPGKARSAPPLAEAPEQRARRRALGDRLRDYYDSVAREPVPDEFDSLLEKLAESGRVRDGGKAD